MKKTVFVSILCIIMVMTLAACGGTPTVPETSAPTAPEISAPVSFEGKYVISAMTYEDEDVLELMTQLAALMGEEDLDFDLEEFMCMEFSGTDTVTFGIEGEEETGTYKLDGNSIALMFGEETMTGTVDGLSFTIEEEDDAGEITIMTFTKK